MQIGQLPFVPRDARITAEQVSPELNDLISRGGKSGWLLTVSLTRNQKAASGLGVSGERMTSGGRQCTRMALK
jgi:hypothetical protein